MRLPHSGNRRIQTCFVATLFFFAALCGCALAPQPGTGNDDPNGNVAQPSAKIAFCDSPGTSCESASSFSISKLRDLNIVVNWSNLAPGNHAQVVTVLHGGDGPYQTFHKGFIVGEDAGGSFSASAALPVAGTWIVQRSLTGTWTVQASLDGHLVASETVALTP